jgi:hypothetical protein
MIRGTRVVYLSLIESRANYAACHIDSTQESLKPRIVVKTQTCFKGRLHSVFLLAFSCA